MRKLAELLIITLTLMVAGCSDQSTSPDTPQNVQTADQNVPAQIQTLLDLYANDQGAVLPEVALGPDYANIPNINDTSYDVYSVTLLWGEFFNASASTAPTDWSGKMWVNGVADIGILTTIDFEIGEDSIIATDVPSEAVWVSQTHHDFDGISFLVFLKHGITYVAEPRLYIETGPFTKDFGFGQLEQYAAFFVVDDQNGIGILSRRIKHIFCPSGTITGTWTKDENTGNSGSLSGLWYDGQGGCIASYAGKFWSDNDGSRHIQGYISGCLLTVVLGEFEGTWMYDDPTMCPMCGEGHGVFKARYKLYDDHYGYFVGEFGSYGIPLTERELPIRGFWKELCSDVSVTTFTTDE